MSERVETKEEISNIESILEGLLFIAGDDGLTMDDLVHTMDYDESTIATALNHLKEKYAGQSSGIELDHFGATYKLLSKPFISRYASKLFSQIENHTLSQSALEVLSIIAYKQPITRVEIEEIRGVGCDMMLRKLQARGLIQEAGRSEAPGRPFLYEVTPAFLDAFQLVSLDELPKLPQFGDGSTTGDDNLFNQ